MRPFFMESVFWMSLGHRVLRSWGLSRTRPFRVLVRAEPLSLRDAGTGTDVPGGFFLTRVVMAESDERARAAALAHARDAVRAIVKCPGSEVTVCEVEESNAIEGVVWRQPRGYSFFSQEQA